MQGRWLSPTKVKTHLQNRTYRHQEMEWTFTVKIQELKCHFMEKNGQVEEATKDLLKGYRKQSRFMEKSREMYKKMLSKKKKTTTTTNATRTMHRLSCPISDLFSRGDRQKLRRASSAWDPPRSPSVISWQIKIKKDIAVDFLLPRNYCINPTKTTKHQ